MLTRRLAAVACLLLLTGCSSYPVPTVTQTRDYTVTPYVTVEVPVKPTVYKTVTPEPQVVTTDGLTVVARATISRVTVYDGCRVAMDETWYRSIAERVQPGDVVIIARATP